jgi:hypothetical protein
LLLYFAAVLPTVGYIMYGAASTRARVIPRGISITIIVAGLMSGVPIAIVYLSGGVVHGLAFVWLGAWMLKQQPSLGCRRPHRGDECIDRPDGLAWIWTTDLCLIRWAWQAHDR